MADIKEPPPLFGDEDEIEKDQDSDDLFATTSQPKKVTKTKEEEDADLFAGGGTEVSLDDNSPGKNEKAAELEVEKTPVSNDIDKEPSVAAKVGVLETPNAISKSTTSSTGAAHLDGVKAEEEEEDDQFSIEITVTEPKKVGDGMSAYMVYRVITKTTIPAYKKAELSVNRRFSDFVGLRSKLNEKHQHLGRVVPPAPEKSVLGATKIKVSKEDSSSNVNEFVEKRRASLERFLNRIARHPVLVVDSDFREFLELDGDLPKATSTSALSGAGVLRLFNKMGDAVGKMTFKMDETDQWFEDKQQQIESLDQQLRKLHSSVEALVHHRKELAGNTSSFAKSAAMLGNAEEHTALSRAMSQLAEVEDRLDQLHLDQADSDYFVFSELVKDYVSLITAVKEVFHARVKLFKQWKEAEAMLAKKREKKAQLELGRKMDKIPQAAQEITEWELKVEKGQEEFENISKMIRKEMVRFDKQRVKDFKSTIINYLEALMNSQQQIIKHWETFLPEAKAIA